MTSRPAAVVRTSAPLSSIPSNRPARVVLPVRAGALHARGHAFYRSANGVWLTDAVPPGFIAFEDAIGA